MNIQLLKDFFLWSLVINMGVLLWWLAMLTIAHDWVYRFHRRWFRSLSIERFDAIHYAAMAAFKLLIFIFNVTPYLALIIIT